MPASNPPENEVVFRLPRRALRFAAIAFGMGLLLFVIVWWLGRDKAFYKPEPAQAGKSLDMTDALPEPLPAGEGASDMPDAAPARQDDRPQLVEAPPVAMPEPIDETTLPVAPDAVASTSDGNPVPLAPGDQPVPLRDQNPAPRYPANALRNGENGTVLVRVEVDANGMPAGVALVQRSGSRDLDRAAMETVRRWRFQPAQREGRAVSGSVVIPIEFKTN